MKIKIKVAIGAFALLASGMMASAQTVYSSNAVGFQKIELGAQTQVLASTPFNNADSTLPALFNGQLQGGSTLSTADNVFKWDADLQKYSVYFPLEIQGNPNNINGNWVEVGGQGFANDATLEPGESAWIINRTSNAKTVVFVGEVPTAAKIPVDIKNGLNMVFNPYPAVVELVGSTLTTAGIAGSTSTTADNVYLWDPINKVYSIYWLAGFGGQRFWVRVDNGFNGGAGQVTELDLEPGGGMWYLGRSPMTWEVNKPYAYP